jgi:hypothetical protein
MEKEAKALITPITNDERTLDWFSKLDVRMSEYGGFSPGRLCSAGMYFWHKQRDVKCSCLVSAWGSQAAQAPNAAIGIAMKAHRPSPEPARELGSALNI